MEQETKVIVVGKNTSLVEIKGILTSSFRFSEILLLVNCLLPDTHLYLRPPN